MTSCVSHLNLTSLSFSFKASLWEVGDLVSIKLGISVAVGHQMGAPDRVTEPLLTQATEGDHLERCERLIFEWAI
jgi:hypothetical protein